jgi:hypothetical protein
MMQKDVYAKALARAALIVGGDDVLAIELGVTPEALSTWMRFGNPPVDVFLRAVDIVVEHDARPDAILKHQPPNLPKA